MKLLEIDKTKKAKYSFEFESELSVSNDEKTETCLSRATNILHEKRAFTLELVLSSNASYYALVGARYTSASGDKLHIEIRYSDGITENYENTLAYNKKTVFKGLSEEYAETVKKTASDFLLLCNEIPSGKVIFDVAACCEVGSSPRIFSIVTKIVLHVLLNKEYPVSDEIIKNICEEYLSERNRSI